MTSSADTNRVAFLIGGAAAFRLPGARLLPEQLDRETVYDMSREVCERRPSPWGDAHRAADQRRSYHPLSSWRRIEDERCHSCHSTSGNPRKWNDGQ
jgi:hypothetical protein